MIKVALLGLGRTGAVVADQLLNSPTARSQFELVAAIAKPGSQRAGRPLREFVKAESDLPVVDASQLRQEILTKKFKVAIDFTSPEATLQNAGILAESGINLVIGTTGFNTFQLCELKQLVRQYRTGLVYAPNISIGINLLLSVVKTIARLAPQYDVEITETCHHEKQDAPSGTALKIAHELNNIFGVAKPTPIQCGRKGKGQRRPGEIGIHSIHAGGIAGVHQVLFAGESEEIEITHRSYSRVTYAEGALKAAAFIHHLRGFYHMEDVLLNERMERDLRIAANRLYLKFN